jgi:hypothetical protein
MLDRGRLIAPIYPDSFSFRIEDPDLFGAIGEILLDLTIDGLSRIGFGKSLQSPAGAHLQSILVLFWRHEAHVGLNPVAFSNLYPASIYSYPKSRSRAYGLTRS